jgi:hypothetical protein
MENSGMGSQTMTNWIMAIFTVVIAGVEMRQCHVAIDSERPWIGPTTRTVGWDKSNEKVLVLYWKYVNGGKSPALNLRFNLNLKIGSPLKEKVDTIDVPSVERCKNRQSLPGAEGYMAMPGAEQIFIAPPTPDIPDSSESIVANRVGLYFVGCLDYEDVSGRNHRTNVCELYLPKSHIFLPCARGNNGN